MPRNYANMMEELLFERLRNILLARGIFWQEKKMMGGVTFMVDEKMCFGTFKRGLLCRVDPGERDLLLDMDGVAIMRQGGREMKGYIHVQPESYEVDEELEFWVNKCLEFNPKAKSSRKKRKKS